MTTLVKAQLCEVSGDTQGSEVGEPIDVQFNPTSLRVAISNKTTGGSQAGSQAKQKPGTGEVQVTFDLFFDTADEGETTAPVPVTKRTQIVEKFVRPKGNTPSQQSPPRVQFKWGTFQVQGVMESANIDMDLFAADGTPLRAKVSVSIKGQDPSYRYDPLPPPSAAAGGSGGSGSNSLPPGTPGTSGSGSPIGAVTEALPGESLSGLASRMGLDPSAWRALAVGIGDPTSLSPGQQIPIPASLPNNGVGTAASSSTPPPLVSPTTLPSAPRSAAPAPTASSNPVVAGKALVRQGGVQGTISATRQTADRGAAAASVAGFGLTPPSIGTGSRPYGGGVPLRPVIGSTGSAPVTPDPTIPGWRALMQRANTGVNTPNRLRPRDPCQCDCTPTRKG